jgi:hypothetical protein
MIAATTFHVTSREVLPWWAQRFDEYSVAPARQTPLGAANTTAKVSAVATPMDPLAPVGAASTTTTVTHGSLARVAALFPRPTVS